MQHHIGAARHMPADEQPPGDMEIEIEQDFQPFGPQQVLQPGFAHDEEIDIRLAGALLVQGALRRARGARDGDADLGDGVAGLPVRARPAAAAQPELAANSAAAGLVSEENRVRMLAAWMRG